ncbi:uncharacterized protein LOC125218943 isoform X2 [Salvia hispanica]|uniref:uncharacterized protein LOC125218943 isoform X2 n=1 Tax=Salvia hispanica TaxID=49212 RepID=UPI0020094527|nr:uncharacterized protein LOC125218943 isoform X2 [Salvia hispanica]
MEKSSEGNQNSNLPSEEKSSNSSENVLLSQQTKQLSTTSDLAQEVNDVKQKEVDGEAKSDGKEESPPLPSPQQPKEQPEGKSSLAENVSQSENSSAATATTTTTPQKIELQKNLIIEQENDDLVINKITANSSQVISDENTTTTVKASSKVNPGEGQLRVYIPGQHYVIVEIDDTTNGGATVPLLPLRVDSASTIVHKEEATCIQCNALVTEEWVRQGLAILNIKCKCSDTSLLHLICKEAWLQLKGDKCSHCDQKIRVKSVKLGFSFPQTDSDNSHAPELEVSTWKRSCCCWHD